MWQPPPMPKPASAPWGLIISEADFKRLKKGLEPESMDDKYQIKATEDSDSGAVTIHWVRAFHDEFWSLVIKKYDDDNSNTIYRIDTINWAQVHSTVPISEALAKKQVVVLSRCNLECDFEAAPAYDEPDFYDEPAEDNIVNGTK
ncbi:hypothetical protein CkaCkLH20_07253 [Colletotrichum karsti]|uniref:Uncharacterized protein n=1 Tax=Colletotrichum karsti TaxID=1095194 RepID=A0A9P6I2U8_9PEZI|nr:uncharacterized protein CkaCkLH20_07253 [Colletotrichum karsti]KAF9875433.1 hypothetical protein CkaCkLH20_07253 [Colletotrichum karsti]